MLFGGQGILIEGYNRIEDAGLTWCLKREDSYCAGGYRE